MTGDDKDQEHKEYSLLHSIGTVLTSSLNLQETLQKIFDILDVYMGIQVGVLALENSYSDVLETQVSYGTDGASPDHEPVWKALIKDAYGKEDPFVIDKISPKQSPLGFDERYQLQAHSFICAPIALGLERFGGLCIYTPYYNPKALHRYVNLLGIVALMVAQEVKLTQLLQAEQAELRNENIRLRDELTEKYNIHNMVGNSSAMHQVYESITQVADSNASVLIRGESGTGKELVAHAIHYNSPRADGPFVKINCGAIPESLIESELFGHEKGAFTDAQQTKIGKFEAANGGTIFLDEIGELSAAIQVKLLRVIQEREIERVGGLQHIKVNVRIVTATNRDLEKEVSEKRFREDLYYRLNVFPIFLPPLRDRKSDILLLAEHFVSKFSEENNKEVKRISNPAIDLLTSYHWPGNVRELENCMARAVLLCAQDTIQAAQLPPTLQAQGSLSDANDHQSLEDAVAAFERELIVDALAQNRGNKTKAAGFLNTTPRIIGYKISQLGIDVKAIKNQVKNSA